MSLSSLKEIKLDFGWMRDFFYSKIRTYNDIKSALDLDNLPKNSWILDMKYDDDGEFVKFCADKHPQLNFVFFHNSPEDYAIFKDQFPRNVHVFYMTSTEFVNPAYDEFIVRNKVGYRRVISCHVDNDNILSKIDKSLYKDYGNTIPSTLIVIEDKRLREGNPYFNQYGNSNKYYPINDFNNN